MTRSWAGFVVVSVFVVAAAACGGGSGDDDDNAAADGGAGGGDGGAADAASGTPDGAGPSGFQEIIAREWSLPAGTELYRCTRVTLTEDMYVAAFRAIAPLGTHHTVLSVNETPTAADGDYDCGPTDLAHNMLFASGVGTDELAFPTGTAMKLHAGNQISLNLHLFNVSDGPLSGRSGTEIAVIPASQVVNEAEVVFGGTIGISIPPDPANEKTVVGGCTFTAPAKVITVWPHMHQIGRHMKVVHEASGGDVTLHDKDYSFNEQVNWPITPVDVAAGERIRIECTYLNDTGSTITFGDSSEDEMCFAGLYRYPATGAGLFDCVEF